MGLIDQIAAQYGADSNWNGLRGRKGDPLLDQFAAQYGADSNWNAYRPTSAPAAPAQPSQPAASPTTSSTAHPSYSPSAAASSSGTPSPSGFNFDWSSIAGVNPNVPNYNYDAYIKKLLDSGVGQQESTDTANSVFQKALETAVGLANTNAYGFDKNKADSYWLPMFEKDPGYTWERLIGRGAGAQDAAKYGPWAGGDPNAENPGGNNPGVNHPSLSDPGNLAQFTEFDDPAAKLLEQLALDRVNRLSQTPSRPNLDQYVSQLLETQARQKQQAADFANTLRARETELNKPAYTDDEDAVIRAKAFDQFERRRQETLKNAREDIYARGFAPTSGIAIGSDRDVNNQFEEARTGIESDLLKNAIDETQRRKDKAVQLEQIAQQALSGADLGSLQMSAQVADLEDQLIQEANQQERERLVAAGIPVDLGTNRAQLALSILGQGGNPSSVLNGLLGIAQLGQNNRALNLQSANSNLMGLGALAKLFFGNQGN